MGYKLFCPRKFFIFILLALLAAPQWVRADARIKSDPDAPTNEEAKVLGWGPVKTPNRGKNPEFLVRGVVLEVQKAKEGKNTYDIKILPIEILNNHQRVLTFDNFQTGVDITLNVGKERLKDLEKGRLVEYNQYYTEEVEQTVGGAKMIAMQMHREIQGYPKGPEPFLETPGLYPVQYKNAIKGAKLYEGALKDDPEVKAHLDYLASSSKDPELKTIAKETYLEIYQVEPSGTCKLDKKTNLLACATP